MALTAAATDIRACLASLEDLIEKDEKFIPEFDALRKAQFKGPDIHELAHAISFPEVRELDLLCQGVLERHASAYPELAQLAARWNVHELEGMAGPEGLHTDLVQKRTVLKHALNVITAGSTPDAAEHQEEPEGERGRWPTLLGRIRIVPRGLGVIADIGGGIAVLLAVSHWVFGLF